MSEYSNFIVEAMKYVDEKIEQIDYRSIDRQRLHSKINTQIAVCVKKLISLSSESAYKEIDNIFRTQLLEEISRNL